ncbi:TetR/AcrR family transcriptional regulator [Pseudomonas aeruginosa]|nr:TetR/AcrR family transcriptional regulator [Pseudomonas aeruginosa]
MKTMRLGREEKQRLTREKLFEAATELMVRKGYHAASISDIAERAGFSKGAFFSNFSSKAELLLALTQRFKRVEIERLEQALVSAGSTLALRQGVAAYIDSLKHNRACMILEAELRLIAARDDAFARHYHALHQENSRVLGRLIERIFNHRGKRSPLPPEGLATLFTALSEGMVLQGHGDPAREIKLVLEALIEQAPALPLEA